MRSRDGRIERWWRYAGRDAPFAATLALAVGACSLLPIERVESGWIVPTPFPLPPGAQAVPLVIATLPRPLRPDIEYGACPLALLSPVRVEYRAGDQRPVHFHAVASGEEIRIRWPEGFSARLNPALAIVAPDGSVIARDGEVVDGLSGGNLDRDDSFTVCMGEYTPRRARPTAP